MFTTAQVIETTRGAIQSIHHGQMEAGKAIGLTLRPAARLRRLPAGAAPLPAALDQQRHRRGEGQRAGLAGRRGRPDAGDPAGDRPHLRAAAALCPGGRDLLRDQLQPVEPVAAGSSGASPTSASSDHDARHPSSASAASASRSATTACCSGVDLDVRRGEVVTIIGPSGSGKTTLLRCVNLLETYDGGQHPDRRRGGRLPRPARAAAGAAAASASWRRSAPRPAWCSSCSTCSRISPRSRT